MPRRKVQEGKDVLEERRTVGMYITKSEEKLLRNRGFHVLKHLNSGVSADIYLTAYMRDPGKQINLACKVVDKRKVNTKFLMKFLPREISILSRLANPHCVQVHSILDDRNKCFLFMRWAENGDLLEYLTEHGQPSESHLKMWMRQLLLALKYLHANRIAHRDIKCENILITKNLNAKLGDFGFARYWADQKGREILSSTFCGSMSYTAPEILAGSPYCPKSCDVWSLGVVFFITLDLHKPFSKPNARSLLKLQLNRQYVLSSKTEERITPLCKDILQLILEPDQNLRPTAEMLLRHEWITQDELLTQLIPDETGERAGVHMRSSS